MNKNHFDQDLDQLIRQSIKLTEQPSQELNHTVKAALYRQEAAAKTKSDTQTVSLWFLPMVLNLITFLLLAAAALISIHNMYLSYFTAGICWYAGFAGILLTAVGLKRTNLKENMTIRIQKGGTGSMTSHRPIQDRPLMQKLLRCLEPFQKMPVIGKFCTYEIISYLICGVLTTVVNYVSYFVVRALGGNAVVEFKYGQKSSFWQSLLGLDDVSWYASGKIARINPESLPHR